MNKTFKMNERVFYFDNFVEKPQIVEGRIVGAIEKDDIYKFVYFVQGSAGDPTPRRPYQIYKTLDELKDDILNYAVLANVD